MATARHYPGETLRVDRDCGEISVYGHVDKLEDVDEEALESFIHIRRKFNFDKEQFTAFIKSTPLVFTKMMGHWVPDVNEEGWMQLSEVDAEWYKEKRQGWFAFTTIGCDAEVKACVDEYGARRASGDVYPP